MEKSGNALVRLGGIEVVPANKVSAFAVVRAFLTGDVPVGRRALIGRLRRPVPILKLFVDVVLVQISQHRVTNQENGNRTDEGQDICVPVLSGQNMKTTAATPAIPLTTFMTVRFIELMALGGRLTSWSFDCTQGNRRPQRRTALLAEDESGISGGATLRAGHSQSHAPQLTCSALNIC